jgi:hypothetical protein
MTPAERERRRAELMAELVELAQDELPEPAKTLDELEDLTARVSEEAARHVLEKLAERQQETDRPTERTCPQCQRRAQYKGRYALEIVTSLGRIRLRRPYFYCAACRQGTVPLDAAWRLGPGNTTPKAQARVAYLAHSIPYHRLPASFQQLGLPLRLDVSTCEKITQVVGAALERQPPAGPQAGTGVLVIQVDGVMFPTRDGYREAQCGTLYEPDPQADRSVEGCASLRKEFWGTIQDRAAVIAEACRRLEARRSSVQQRVGVMGDGAHWIWEDFAPRVPNRQEILDFYHAAEHLAVVAAARFGDSVAARERWLTEMRHELRHIGPWRVIREVERWRPMTAAAQKVRREELGYLRRNRDRMHYPTYVREGFAIGTGAVEGACKNLVGARLKGAGMRWNPATARPVVHVRAALLTHPLLDLRPYAGGATAAVAH